MDKSKGFTLIELLISSVIVVIISGVAISIFIAAIKVQNRMIAYEKILDNTSYVMERMSRFMRMAQKDKTATCLSAANMNYELTAQGIKFLSYHTTPQCIEYYLSGTQLREKIIVGGNTVDNPISPSTIDVVSFHVTGQGWDQSDNVQPRVTIYLEVKEKNSLIPAVRLQTSITQRNLDTE